MPRTCSLSESQISELRRLYETTQLTQEQIAEAIGSTGKVVWRFIHKNYTKGYSQVRKVENYRQSKLGDKNPQYGLQYVEALGRTRYVGASGYVSVPKPEWYTGRKGKSGVYEHTVVVCQSLGLTEIPAGFAVHHIDGDRSNNDLDNLALMTLVGHARLHARERAETRLSSRRGVTAPKRTASVEAIDSRPDDDIVRS